MWPACVRASGAGRRDPGPLRRVPTRLGRRRPRGVHTRGSQVTSGGAHADLPGGLAVRPRGSRGTRGRAGGRAPLPLPPSSPPAQGAPLGSETNPGQGGAAVPPPHSPAAPIAHLLAQQLPQSRGFRRRMRFWLRNEEMALEEMVQRLNAASRRTGRRSRWP